MDGNGDRSEREAEAWAWRDGARSGLATSGADPLDCVGQVRTGGQTDGNTWFAYGSAPEVVYGVGRIDASGRIADRTGTSALGWRGGDRLTVTADAGAVTARRDPRRQPSRAVLRLAVQPRRAGRQRRAGPGHGPSRLSPDQIDAILEKIRTPAA